MGKSLVIPLLSGANQVPISPINKTFLVTLVLPFKKRVPFLIIALLLATSVLLSF